MRTKCLHYFLFVLLSFCALASFSQGCPPNIDFESGNFSKWECSIGYTTVSGGQNQIVLSSSAPTPGRHEIISASTFPQLDPYGDFPKLCP
jgi:hypothetical protein